MTNKPAKASKSWAIPCGVICSIIITAVLFIATSFSGIAELATAAIIQQAAEKERVSFPAPEEIAATETIPEISSPRACVMDEQGNVLYDKNMYDETYIASITKMMTAIVVLDYCNLDEIVTMSDRTADIIGTLTQAQPGDTFTVAEGLEVILCGSTNDIAFALGEHVGEKALAAGEDLTAYYPSENSSSKYNDAFAALMNKKAAELGLEHTVFTNPMGQDHGIYSEAHSCAHDVAVLALYGMQYETFANCIHREQVSFEYVHKGVTVSETRYNPDHVFFNYEYSLGGKTGETDKAQFTHCGIASNGTYLVASVSLNSTDQKLNLYDNVHLCDWAFDFLSRYYAQ